MRTCGASKCGASSSTLDRITFESVGAKSQIQVPLEFSPLIPLEQPACLNCLLRRAGLQSAPLHIIPWLILPPPHSLCGCTAESLLTLPHALPSHSSWSMLPTSFSLWLYCGEPACAPSCTSLALLLVLMFLALFPRAPLGRWL